MENKNNITLSEHIQNRRNNCKFNTLAHIHDRSLSRLCKGTSIKKSGGVKQVLCVQTCTFSEMMCHTNVFPHVSKLLPLTYNQANSVIKMSSTFSNNPLK